MLTGRISRLTTRSEEGSLILTMSLVLVVSLAIVGVLLTVSGGLQSARIDQNRTNAFQYANAGIDQVLYRLDKQDLPASAVGNYAPTSCYPAACGTTGSFVTGFTDRVVTGGNRFDVVAEAVPAGQPTAWKVRSIGTDSSGQKRQAITTVSATPIFENGFLTLTNFFTNGEQTFPAGYDSFQCPDPRVNAAAPGCDLTFGGTQPVPTRLGTNGILKLAASTADGYFKMWQGVDMWGRSTQAAADGDCQIGGGGQLCNERADYPDKWAKPHTNQQTVTYYPSTGASGCPNATGTFTNESIAPGRYLCPQLNLNGNIAVSGTSGDVVFLVEGAVTINADAKVNVGQASTRFQVYQKPTGPIPAGAFCGGSSDNPSFWGILSAPRLEVGCTGSSQPEIYGAVIARFYDGPGAHFKFHWDSRSQYVVNDGKFVVRDWRECPATSTDC